MRNEEELLMAYLINNDGDILKKVLNPFQEVNPLSTANHISEIFNEEDRKQVELFLHKIDISQYSVTESFSIRNSGLIIPIQLVGIKVDQGIFVIGSNSVKASELKIIEELLIINNEQANKIRTLHKELAKIKNTAKENRSELYNQFTAINNELANTQRLLAKKNTDLQRSLKEIDLLSKMIPICSNCKKIRDDDGFWQNVENYLSMRSKIVFSHSICPSCMEKLYPEFVRTNKKTEG